MENINWVFNLKNNVLKFMNHMKGKVKKGYYKYSYDGDLYNENIHWNTGSSVFALKIYYTLGLEKNDDILNAAKYIKSFQNKSGLIYDPLIYKKSIFNNFKNSIKNLNFDILNLINYRYKIADSRQCYSSLLLYDCLPDKVFYNIPLDEKGIVEYLNKLSWNNPWSAGSHFSHLMFFYKILNIKGIISNNNFNELTDFVINFINKMQKENDGAWYKSYSSLQQKINGAMKIITGMVIVDKLKINYPDKLIDTCITAVNNKQACDNFNIIYVLKNASKIINSNYRKGDIEKFTIDRLNIYKKYYHEDKGGFSFFPDYANVYYYGAKITKGNKEPDIHGTVLFLWGISIISQILDINNELGFKEFKT